MYFEMGVRFLLFEKIIADNAINLNNFHGSNYGRSFYEMASSELRIMVNSDGFRSSAYLQNNDRLLPITWGVRSALFSKMLVGEVISFSPKYFWIKYGRD